MRICLLLPLILAACSSGPATMDAELLEDEGVLRLVVHSEGKNIFTVAGQACEAPSGGNCSLEVPLPDLGSGWIEVTPTGQRRIGGDGPPIVRVHLGDSAFPRDCKVSEVGDAWDGASLWLDVACELRPGYSATLAGRPMEGGKGRVQVGELVAPEGEVGSVDRPLVRRDLPIVIHNRSGAERPRPLAVAVPVPLVQLSVEGWEDPWFETELPVRVRAEDGATLWIDGARVVPPRAGASFVHTLPVRPGANEFVIEASQEGKVSARTVLHIGGEAPHTPLIIESPEKTKFTTTDPVLHLSGRTSPEAKLFVDRVPVQVSAEGFWVFDARLEEGENEVAVIAEVDGSVGSTGRPRSSRIFEVRLDPKPNLRVRETEQRRNTQAQAAFADITRDPTMAPGALVRFHFVIEEVQTSLTKTGCRARLLGRGCTDPQAHRVRVGFVVKDAWACVGELWPTVVDTSTCPEAEAGDWMLVNGDSAGVLGGRVAERTVARPLVQASSIEIHPLVGVAAEMP